LFTHVRVKLLHVFVWHEKFKVSLYMWIMETSRHLIIDSIHKIS